MKRSADRKHRKRGQQDVRPPVEYLTLKQLGWVKQPPASAWRKPPSTRKQ